MGERWRGKGEIVSSVLEIAIGSSSAMVCILSHFLGFTEIVGVLSAPAVSLHVFIAFCMSGMIRVTSIISYSDFSSETGSSFSRDSTRGRHFAEEGRGSKGEERRGTKRQINWWGRSKISVVNLLTLYRRVSPREKIYGRCLIEGERDEEDGKSLGLATSPLSLN